MCPVGTGWVHFKCPLPWDSNWNLAAARISLQPVAAALATSSEREPGLTPTQRYRGPGFPPCPAKRTGLMVDHKTSRESRYPYTCSPSLRHMCWIGWLQTGLASLGTRCAPPCTGHCPVTADEDPAPRLILCSPEHYISVEPNSRSSGHDEMRDRESQFLFFCNLQGYRTVVSYQFPTKIKWCQVRQRTPFVGISASGNSSIASSTSVTPGAVWLVLVVVEME